MKKIFLLLFVATAFSCSQKKMFEVVVRNNSTNVRNSEMVEVSRSAVENKVPAFAGKSFIILNAKKKEIPYQITYDNKIIFQVDVDANGSSAYKFVNGTPKTYQTLTCGKQYPIRVDDIAWENDCIAFRTYGPALQASGEKAYGLDVWVKSVPGLVVDKRYMTENDPQTKARIAELKKTDKKAAQALADSTSYHIDHGNGLDYYKVGPTLGDGTSALLSNGKIVYPYCYKEYEILDNGPLRFTAKMVYNPVTVKNNSNIIETRVISLDAGSQLNKISVSYKNLNEATPIATGIVLHSVGDYTTDAANGYITYCDPNDKVNGQIYLGAVFPKKVNEAKAELFSAAEKKERDAEGHVLAVSTYNPGMIYTYFAGAGWSKGGFATPSDWLKYVSTFAQNVKSPLVISIKYQANSKK